MPEAGAADSRQRGFAAIPQILAHLKNVAQPRYSAFTTCRGELEPDYFRRRNSHSARRSTKVDASSFSATNKECYYQFHLRLRPISCQVPASLIAK